MLLRSTLSPNSASTASPIEGVSPTSISNLSVPSDTTAEEVEYFHALCLYELSNKTRAEGIWRKLARNPHRFNLLEVLLT
jgi:hypothetical protein